MNDHRLYMKGTIIFFILFHLGSGLMGQGSITEVIPPSPEAAGLGKYGDIPVSAYTGIPSISIPIYTIDSRGLQVPISLSYHAGGVRVEEEASWVGLGWSLNAGGAITRNIRGKDDFGSYGYYSVDAIEILDAPEESGPIIPGYPLPYTPFPSMKISGDCFVDIDSISTDMSSVFLGNGATQFIDFEPDIFYYNFMGYSGKFILEQDERKAIIIKNEKIRIELINGSWKLTTQDGTMYEFMTTEKTDNAGNAPITAWYLSKIKSINGEEINFHYSLPIASFPISKVSELRNERGDLPNPCPATISNAIVETRSFPKFNKIYLERIEFKNGFVTFERSDPTTDERKDLLFGRKLKRIKVYENPYEEGHSFTPFKEFVLDHSYFVGKFTNVDNHYSTTAELQDIERVRDRLRLDSVTEITAGESKPPHTFGYHYDDNDPLLQLPYKSSYSRDHWGFYNGIDNTTLIPEFKDQGYQYFRFDMPGANREPSEGPMKVGILNKITYPTGGSTVFNFETNDYRVEGGYFPDDRQRQLFTSQGTVETETFSVGSNPQGARMEMDLIFTFNDCNQVANSDAFYFTLLKIDGGVETVERTWASDAFNTTSSGSDCAYNAEEVFTLNTGQYKLKIDVPNSIGFDFYSNIGLYWREDVMTPPSSKIGAGLRIRKIVNNDGFGLESVRKFHYDDQEGLSYGRLMSEPVYEFFLNAETFNDVGACAMTKRFSTTNLPLSTSAQGSPVGYDQVTEIFGKMGENGKRISVYENQIDHSYNFSKTVPDMVQFVSNRNGSLKQQSYYSANGSIISESINHYNFEDINLASYRLHYGAKIEDAAMTDCSRWSVFYYPIFSEWIYKTHTEERVYDQGDPSRYSGTISYMDYDEDHLQVTKTTTTNSNGEINIIENKYAQDFENASDPEIYGSRLLRDNHMHAQVLEQTNTVTRGNNDVPISRSETYYSNESGFILPKQQITYFKGVTGTGPDNPPVKSVSVDYAYDNNGNIKEVERQNGNPTSYIWGYGGTLPIAKVDNASSTEVAFTDFESDEKGGWTYGLGGIVEDEDGSRTGTRYYKGNLSHPGTGLSPDSYYIVSFWSKGTATAFSPAGTKLLGTRQTNGWEFKEYRVKGGQSLTINAPEGLEGVRLHPEDALMTTFSYNPLRGMTSATDPSGKTIYYEYDGFGRLEFTRDLDGNILNKYEYNYRTN